MNKNELQMAIAYLFRSKGTQQMRDKEMILEMSMKRKWFTYSKAVLAFEEMVEKELLAEADGSFEPTFDIESIDVPSNFVPDLKKDEDDTPVVIRKSKVKEDEQPIDWKEEAIIEWGISKNIIEASRDKWKEDLGVGDAGALLLAGYENGANVSALIQKVRKEDSTGHSV